MIRIGITGGIGSGKSVTARLMRIMNIPVYDADSRSKGLLDSSPVIREALILIMGREIYSGGMINRRLKAWASQCDHPVCAIESAILFESGFNKAVDVTLMISAPLDLRISRAMTRDRSDRSAIEQRLSRQMPDEEKILLADYVIVNDGARAVIPQVEEVLRKAMGA